MAAIEPKFATPSDIVPSTASVASVSAYPLGYLPALDGMRGLMTIVVLIAHTGLKFFPTAALLMDIFFAMSGYLITSILLKDFSKRGRIDFKKFYLRRLARLYPALVAMLMTLLLFSYFTSPDFKARLIEAAIAFFYVNNYWALFFSTPVPYTAPLWSLAVEEQFYLLWPLMFSILLSKFGAGWRTLQSVLAAAAAFALIRIILVVSGASWLHLYVAFHTRADAFLWGCAAAIALPLIDLTMWPRLSRALAYSLAPLLVFTIGYITTYHNWNWYYAISPLVGAIPGVVAVAALVQPHRTFMHKFYEFAPFVFCGRICYGLYVWHALILVSIQVNYGRTAAIMIGLPLVFAVATASFYWIERPFMRSRPV